MELNEVSQIKTLCLRTLYVFFVKLICDTIVCLKKCMIVYLNHVT